MEVLWVQKRRSGWSLVCMVQDHLVAQVLLELASGVGEVAAGGVAIVVG